MPIKEARRQLIKHGCSKAEGDVLRFMYANLLAFEHRLSIKANSFAWPIPQLYEALGKVADSEIASEYRRLVAVPNIFDAV